MPEIGKEVGKERILGGLLKTGQTTSYNSYADDGYYEKGLSKQYTILTAGQYDGTTSITLYNRTDLISNNCVYDRRTRLMWSRDPSDGLGPSADGKLPWTTNTNGEGIFTYLDAANLAKVAGYSDWRIPNVYELQSLLNYEAPSAKPDTTAFPVWPDATAFWSSTTEPASTTQAIRLVYVNAYISATNKQTAHYVALVRGG